MVAGYYNSRTIFDTCPFQGLYNLPDSHIGSGYCFAHLSPCRPSSWAK
jgi:hypothetical protein